MEEDEAEEEVSKGGMIMTLLWWGTLEVALVTILGAFVLDLAISAQKGTLSMDRLMGLLPWLIILAVGVVLVGWVTLKIVKNLISIFREGKKNGPKSKA